MKQKIKCTVLLFGLIILLYSCTDNYEEGMKKYNEKNFDNALVYLRKVESTDENYKLAQNKIAEIDSILLQMEKEKIRQDSISNVGEFYNLIHCKSNEYAYICSSKLAKISNAKANIQNTR